MRKLGIEGQTRGDIVKSADTDVPSMRPIFCLYSPASTVPYRGSSDICYSCFMLCALMIFAAMIMALANSEYNTYFSYFS